MYGSQRGRDERIGWARMGSANSFPTSYMFSGKRMHGADHTRTICGISQIKIGTMVDSLRTKASSLVGLRQRASTAGRQGCCIYTYDLDAVGPYHRLHEIYHFSIDHSHLHVVQHVLYVLHRYCSFSSHPCPRGLLGM